LIRSIDRTGTDAQSLRWSDGRATVQVIVVDILPIFVVMLTAAAMALIRLSV
jgi:hypothetical protein